MKYVNKFHGSQLFAGSQVRGGSQPNTSLYTYILYNLEFHVRITSSYDGMHMKVVDANKGGVVAIVEGLRGFVPFSQISTVS